MSHAKNRVSRIRRRVSARDRDPLVSEVAVQLARAAVAELGSGPAGAHVGVMLFPGEGHVATHRFAAAVPGYQGWEWNVVLARAAGSSEVTLNEVVLLPAPSGGALQAPEWVPWSQRIRPGDLHPGEVLPPDPDDIRLTTHAQDSATADSDGPRPRGHYLSAAGLKEALRRWRTGEFGPNSEFAEKASLYCRTCAFFLPLASHHAQGFGVCANEYSADGHVVQSGYGCGAHSETPPATSQQATGYYDDERPIF